MSYGSLGRRSGLSYNPRISSSSSSSTSKPSSSRVSSSLTSSSPISRSLTSLYAGGGGTGVGQSAVDQYIKSAAASTPSYSSGTGSHRRNPHVRRPSSTTSSSIANRLRSQSQNSLNSIGSGTQTYSVMRELSQNFFFHLFSVQSSTSWQTHDDDDDDDYNCEKIVKKKNFIFFL